MALSNAFLTELASEFGIATEFWDWKGRRTDVSDETVIAILAAMDVDASDPEHAAQAVEDFHNRTWTRTIPACVVVEEGRSQQVLAHVPHGEWIRLAVHLEDGGWREVPQVDHVVPPRVIDGRLIGEAGFELPDDLPIGYHRLQATTAAGQEENTLVVSPHFLGFPERMDAKRVWGYSTQLYSIRSHDSWGIGDLVDLADLAIWSNTQQFADFVLVNPLHAAQPKPPLEASPYLPSSRQFINPLYIRPEHIAEYNELPAESREQINAIKARLNTELTGSRRIERDRVWTYKIEALRIVYEHDLSAARRMAFDQFIRRWGRALSHFATWCALSVEYGPNWREWPEELRRPSSPEVAEFNRKKHDEVRFFAWMQWVADIQLRLAQSAARDAGMKLGIMNDLAVGVSKESAEAWVYDNTFAAGVSVGAPPDHFNQLGQDWAQTPWRPDRLADLSYDPFRRTIAGLLRHSGGVRIDHIMGLFRLWWIPEGMTPKQGTYVRYDHEAMVGILLLEAYRVGALVVGEDLGVVEPWVRGYLRDRGILGTSIAWFERDENGQPLEPEQWREYCLASVTSHDLPPTAGYLAKTHVYLQHRLGLLQESLETELENADREQQSFVDLLRRRGFLTQDDPTTEDIVLALHRYLTATPSRVLCAALPDAVGDQQTQNQPGTHKEYPNWQIPLSHPDGVPMTMEELFTDERAMRLAGVMNGFTGPLQPRADAELLFEEEAELLFEEE